MRIPVMIVSGFLGSGKTTFIQKFLSTMPDNKQVMVIENDFGAVSFDAQILASGTVEVQELKQGCICCSLAGDFEKALVQALDLSTVDYVIIEPSGVGKLSDILKVCKNPQLVDKIDIQHIITVVDAKRASLYARNFGDFFVDQITNARQAVITHAEDDIALYSANIKALWQEYNLSTPWQLINWDTVAEDLAGAISEQAPIVIKQIRVSNPVDKTVNKSLQLGRNFVQIQDSTSKLGAKLLRQPRMNKHLRQVAKDKFSTYTVSMVSAHTMQYYQEMFQEISRTPGIIRIKGILPLADQNHSGEKHVLIQGITNNYKISTTEFEGNYCTIIGSKELSNYIDKWTQRFNAKMYCS